MYPLLREAEGNSCAKHSILERFSSDKDNFLSYVHIHMYVMSGGYVQVQIVIRRNT